MMEYIKLSDAANIITGFPFKSEKFNTNGEGIKLIRGKNIGKGFLHWGEDARYWNEEFSEIEKYSLQLDDIIIGMDGSNVGKNFAVVTSNDLPSLLVQRVARVRAREGFDQNYLKYCILNNRFTNYVNDIKTGSAIPHISGTQINNYLIPKYDYSIQKKIGRIINSITKKIELNNEINNNLYELAYKYLKELQYDDGILLSEFGKIQGGYAFKSKDLLDTKTTNRIIKIKNLKNEIKADVINSQFVTNEVIDKLDTKFKIEKGNVAIAMTGAELGKTGFIYGDDKYYLNQRVGLIKGKTKEKELYLNIMALSSDFQKSLNSKGYGSAQPNISVTDIENIIINGIEESNLLKFYNLVKPIYNKIILNCEEILNLKQLRDTLLPKLMNDEIDLDKIEI